MRRRTAAALAAALVACAGARAEEPRRIGGFEVRAVAAGVHLFRNVAADSPGENSLVIERKDGLLVVDAQPTPAAARALLAAIAGVSRAPVRYLVYTHPHVDATGGASAFPKEVLVVASRGTHDLLADPAYDAGAEVRLRAQGSTAWVEPPRVLPVLYAEAPIVLDDPERKVIVVPLPQAHSRGDLWVEIPSSGVIAVGDLMTGDRNPYGAESDPGAWVAALNDLARGPEPTIVPLSGPPVGPLEVRRFRDGLAWIRMRVQGAFTDLVPRERIVPLALEDPKLKTWFDLDAKPSFTRTIVESVYTSVLDDRRKRGMP
jgi:glyoxylase-like metal-dependent hydrolase (beta-lactamase superfamily II)